MRRKVAIIGCGPVGMLGSLLLQHLGISYVSFEKYASPRSHPSAHWLSANSKAIMSQIPGLNGQVDSQQQPFDNFRFYRYVESLFGHQLGITNHFEPTISQRLQKSKQIFGFTPNHIPQNELLKIMFEKVKNKQNLVFDTEIKDIQTKKDELTHKSNYVIIDIHNKPVAQAQNVILCSGVNTYLRSKLPSPLSAFHMEGKKNLMNIINIHFTSKKLASALKQQNHCAMLHFIYGKKLLGILVNHSIDRTGTFVLQIPNYEPFVDLMEVYSARDLISMMFENNFDNVISDLNVVHVGKWKLQGILADCMHKNGIFLAGDSAHAYPPAGGFGMNSGFQDVNQLVHAIYNVQRNKQMDSQKLYTNYSEHRRSVNSQYLKKALQNYNITKDLSICLGYSPNILDYFSKGSLMGEIFTMLPKLNSSTLEAVRLKAMQLMYRRQLLNSPALNLFFDQFDKSIQNVSNIRKCIFENNKNQGQTAPNYYACQGTISNQEIKKAVGNIDTKNVRFYKKDEPGFEKGQKLIGSDGNVIIQ